MYKSYEVIRPVEDGYSDYRINNQPGALRSNNKKWDYIIRICTGCEDPLRRYDSQKGHAFCYSCREALFPETITPRKPFDKRYHHFGSKGHF